MRLLALVPCSIALLSAATCALGAGPWTLTTLDGGYNAGWSTSLRVAPSGQPCVAYWTPGVGVRFAWFDGSAWQVETVPRNVVAPEPAPAAGATPLGRSPAGPEATLLIRTIATSLALDAAGEPWVAHTLMDQDYANQGLLEVSHRVDGAWVTENLITANTPPSIAVDAVGTVHLCFGSPAGLIYATRTAAGWAFTTVDEASTYYALPSLSLDALGGPHVAYVGHAPQAIRYAERVGGAWQNAIVDSTPGVSGPSLAMADADQPRVAYVRRIASGDSRLRYAQRPGTDWWRVELDPVTAQAYQASLALGPSGQPLIAYSRPDQALWFATYDGDWSYEAVAPSATDLSIALDPAGRPLIAHKADISYGVRLATGTTTVGVPPPGPAGAFRVLSCGPNPLGHGRSLGLALESPRAGRVRIEAYDVAGRLVAARAFPLAAGVSRVEWVAPLPRGLCLLRARTADGGVATARIVVLD